MRSALLPVIFIYAFICSFSSCDSSSGGDNKRLSKKQQQLAEHQLPEDITIARWNFHFEHISKAEYDNALANASRPKDVCAEGEDREACLLEATANLSKMDSCFLVQIESGEMIASCYRPNTLNEESSKYELVNVHNDIGYAQFVGTYWEFADSPMTNLKNGNSFKLWGKSPVMSPETKRIIACSFGLEAGYLPNGIQLWWVGQNSLVNEISLEVDHWGPQNPVWVSESEVLFERMIPQFDKEPPFKAYYAKIVVTPRVQ